LRTIVYLHGFISSPLSRKAVMLGDYLRQCVSGIHYIVPEMHHRPKRAIEQVESTCRGVPVEDLTFVGSSLGGFYATHLAEAYEAKAVLINPAVHPDRDLAPYLGPQRNAYTGEAYELTPGHFAELSALKVARIARPQRYLLLAQTGDEVLDYRVAVAFYAGAWQFVQGGGDHAFRDFAAQIPAILRFAGVDAAGVEHAPGRHSPGGERSAIPAT